MFRLSRRLRSESSLRIVVIGNYLVGPITAVPCRAKARPLHPRRSYFAPMSRKPEILNRTLASEWWRRRVPPPGPNGLLRRLFIAIVGLHRQTLYRPLWGQKKD